MTLDLVSLVGVLDAEVAAYPSNVTHSRIDVFGVKLVLQTDGKAVERSRDRSCLLETSVESLGTFQGLVKEDFMKTVALRKIRAR